MATSWAVLKAGKTRAAVFTEILASLQALGFPVTDWAAGGVVRTILDNAFSGALSLLWGGVSSVAQGGFVRLAQALAEADIASWNADPSQHWLYLLATELFDTTPKASAFAEGTVRFTNSGAGAQSITAAQVVATVGGLRFTPISKADGTALPVNVAAGASEFVLVRAESAGGNYNVGQGAISILTASLPGVTVTNTPYLLASSWIVTYGADTETPKQLADRCIERWGRLTLLPDARPADGYKNLAKESHPQVKKVAVWSDYSHAYALAGLPLAGPLGLKNSTITIYLGTDTGPVDPLVAAAVQIVMDAYKGVCNTIEVQPCGTQTWTLAGTVYVQDASLIPTVQAAVEAAMVAYEAELDIGATGRAWEIRARVNVEGVTNFVETLVDFTPAKNALIDINYAPLVYLPQP